MFVHIVFYMNLFRYSFVLLFYTNLFRYSFIVFFFNKNMLGYLLVSKFHIRHAMGSTPQIKSRRCPQLEVGARHLVLYIIFSSKDWISTLLRQSSEDQLGKSRLLKKARTRYFVCLMWMDIMKQQFGIQK